MLCEDACRLRIDNPAMKYIIVYTTARYITADPGGMQMNERALHPSLPVSCAMRNTS